MIASMTTSFDGVSTSALADTYEAGRGAARRRGREALMRRTVELGPRSAGSGGSLGLLLLGRPVPREQLVEPPGRVGGDAREQVAQVGLRIDAGELGGLDQAVEGGRPQATLVRAGEQPVLAADGHGADGPLGGVVVDLRPAVVAVPGQLDPAVEGIADGGRELALARESRHRGLEPALEIGEQRAGPDLPDAAPFIGRLPPRGILHAVEGGDAVERLLGQRRAAGRMDAEEVAPHMAPTGNPGHPADPEELIEPGIAVGLQDAVEAAEMPARVLAPAVGAVAIEHRRRGVAGPRAGGSWHKPQPG